MSEVPKNPTRFSPDQHVEFTVAALMGDDLPTSSEFASDFSEQELNDLRANIVEKIEDKKTEIALLVNEKNRLERAQQLVQESMSLAREKGIE